MRVTFLGTAADHPTPEPWCQCATCATARLQGGRDVRLRSAVLVNDDLLIDVGPDLPAAAARLGLSLAAVQAVLLTHPHGDHLAPAAFHGRDRRWGGRPLPPLILHATAPALAMLMSSDGSPLPLAPLRIAPRPIRRFEAFEIATGGDLEADPRLPVGTGDLPSFPERRYQVWALAAHHPEMAGEPDRFEPLLFALRQVAGPEVAGRTASDMLLYATDTGPFPIETWAMLERLRDGGMRFGATVVDGTLGLLPLERIVADRHLALPQMVAHQRRLRDGNFLAPGAQQLATHLGHQFNPPHEELAALLAPHGVAPAYDGLTITL
jgi:phosphoribosyl 1,2-cyclic phosphate phosphodiesterase